MEILRYAAFTDTPDGGNPAGIVLGAGHLDATEMQAIAADIGYAESAFVLQRSAGRARLRYFAPEAEIPFCGHATIATGVALAEREGVGPLLLDTPVGPIDLLTELVDGRLVASLVTVEPRVEAPHGDVRAELLLRLGLGETDLDGGLPVLLSYAGNIHPVVPVRSAAVLRGLDYDFAGLKELMAAQGWNATVAVVHRRDPLVFEARNPFPPGGVREDPATGSAAASLGAYLRHLGEVRPPVTLTVHQGADVGRPSRITVRVPPSGGLTVSGGAVPLPAQDVDALAP